MSDTEDPRAARIERLRMNVDTWFGAHGADDRQAAMIETAFLMAAADGNIQPAEHDQLIATLTRVTGSRLDARRLRIITGHLAELLATEGWIGRVAAVTRALDSIEDRRAAFQLAAGVSYVDGEVQQEEVRLFEIFAEHFGIPLPEAEVLRDVHRSLFGSSEEVTDPVLMLTKLRGD
ncbi:MAG: TerB family tellurite resistance protein [Deltaproteobacteria bacterium]